MVYTQSQAGFPSWYRVPLTSLSTQNRLHSVNTSISDGSDLGFPLLIGGLVPPQDLSHRLSPYDLPHIFMPLLTSFRSAYHAHRFRSRCSYAVLFIHYNKASQHWRTTISNYDLFLEHCELTKFTHSYL